MSTTKDEPSVNKGTDPPKAEVENDLKTRLITSEIRISELVSQVVELQKKVIKLGVYSVRIRKLRCT